MNKLAYEGGTIAYTAGADIAAGAVVVINGVVGVAQYPIANGATGALATEGVFELSNAGSVSFAQGATVCWDGTNGYAAATGTAIGFAWAASTGGTVLVKIASGLGTVQAQAQGGGGGT